MSDLPAPPPVESPPESPIAQFGVRMAAQPLSFGYADENGDYQVVYFRPRVGMAYKEVLEWQNMRSGFLKQVDDQRERMTEELTALSAIEDKAEQERQSEEMIARYQQDDEERFLLQVDHLLQLVDERDRDEFGAILRERSNPDDVMELLSYLRNRFIRRNAAAVEAVAHVDPTSPPSPPT